MSRIVLKFYLSILTVSLFVAGGVTGQNMPGWKTDWDNISVDRAEIIFGGVPKDGIPPIDKPKYTTVANSSEWVGGREPVILVVIGDDARAFPLQILTFHEIVNTEIGGKPVTVTFCPLCYSTIAFDRELDGVVYDFGVSGMLRHSDMIMYDRQTESLWQQIIGTAIVGDMNGKSLNTIPSQLISFDQFTARYPDGKVLSRDTGHTRNYGKNPYVGYDDIDDRPFLFKGELDGRLPPMERVVTVDLNGVAKAYPFKITRKKKVINDTVGDIDIVVFHAKGAVSALDKSSIRKSEEIGSTGVFNRTLGANKLTFVYKGRLFADEQTGSTWDITGLATAGELEGAQLKAITHGNFFSFAWFAFKPETQLYTD